MRKLVIAAAGAILAAALSAGTGAAAHARPLTVGPAKPVSTQLSYLAVSGPTGVCWSATSACWRDSGGPLDLWPRDIAGDPNQQFSVSYWGQAPNAAGGACSMFSGVGVFTFRSPHNSNDYIGASYYSRGVFWAGQQASSNWYIWWVWQANGVLLNCGDSAARGGPWGLQSNGQYYKQMFTSQKGPYPTWQQVHV